MVLIYDYVECKVIFWIISIQGVPAKHVRLILLLLLVLIGVLLVVIVVLIEHVLLGHPVYIYIFE